VPSRPDVGDAEERRTMRNLYLPLALLAACAMAPPASAQDAGRKPNIVVIMGDDIGIWNIGAYHGA
jgi:hypothetical protein